ncbi:hypothetical protein THAOC_24979 [Thalassiosira oceanica]|uniref:Uncharacterized protein n=1 Tax=Thalassiosira oceanica TaxID=159749 RepID=K0RQF3_THAOC|nr:hypothetical protein THAOC_24979 [Thalassiosira oceanica]|eukprot:EJK55300.1 hypothetical protein THAOC_24979 [Thalassiosira oceanica]
MTENQQQLLFGKKVAVRRLVSLGVLFPCISNYACDLTFTPPRTPEAEEFSNLVASIQSEVDALRATKRDNEEGK